MLDQEIINGILRNENAAFDQLITKYQNLVYGTCYRLLKNQHDAEDLSQEAFMEIFRSAPHLKNLDDMSGWIYRISYTKCISFLRKKNPAKASSKNNMNEVVESMEEHPSQGSRETPHKAMEDKEATIELFKKLDQLPDNQKRAILLHKIEGYSHKEICEIMGLSQASVESLIYRAKVSLRKSLTSYFENY